MDTDKARFALDLMERYDALHWDVLLLRAHGGGAFAPGDDVDRARFRVSRYFANLQALVDGGFIDSGFADKVVAKAARTLCAKLIAPLDKRVREKKQAEPETAVA